MNSTIIPVRPASGADGAYPVHRPRSHGRASAATGPDPGGTPLLFCGGKPAFADFKLTTPAPGVDTGQQLGGIGRAFVLVGVAALCVRGSKSAIGLR
jgi:hypothetical protein